MDEMIGSFNPLLIFIAILLTIMASYTALDLLTLIKSSERNKRFLFIGSIFSMGIGIWVMNFFGFLSSELAGSSAYHIPITVFSMIAAICLTGAAFKALLMTVIKPLHLVAASSFLTLAVLSVHILGLYSLNLTVQFDFLLLSTFTLLIFGSFFFSLWILFGSKNFSDNERTWLKPISALIVTAAIVQGYFLLNRALFVPSNGTGLRGAFPETSIMYLILVITVVILAGLIGSSTLISKRLLVSDTNLKDIKAALDESSIVAITDAKGIITYVNNKFLEISKYSEDDLLGKDHRIVNSGFHSKEFFRNLWRTIGQGKVWQGEIRNRAKDGTFYWVDTTIVPFLNKKGKPFQYVSIRSDITGRKSTEEHLKNTLKEISDIKFALDQSSIVAFTDNKGIITSINEKFCEISKYNREELIGHDHSLLNSGYHSKEFFKELWSTIGTGTVWKGEIRNKAKDASYYWVDTTIIPFLNERGKPYQYLAIRNDITEKKQTEEILHRQDKLAAVGQLAAGVAHEIRNPLTSLRGYAEFLLLDETKEERKEFIEIILDEVERIDTIVEDFMVLAKPKAARLEEKNIIPVIQDVLALLDFEARKKRVKLHFDFHEDIVQIECDENRLKQVFLNFIKNGIEAMPDGGELHVRTKLTNNSVHISIQDTGIGIPPEKVKKIGEPFFTTKENGNGLGLMVSFKIIESHKGKVYIESEPNKGTTFNIVLPAKTA
ncbi:PAS domain-containing sensor histidine kinase [Bacillus sp. V3-13]|uniref:PAS domain-containing protein n=1 Tax=Bacillus sp. V3-13 TaxID=2053728 RepID=UPI000C774880|nr:PAS domain-containing protein [Bacillus sp. V3-13]PLR76674.1 PAS domain-containing sensor histidine kinase [Bacillus sp. V3-13]